MTGKRALILVLLIAILCVAGVIGVLYYFDYFSSNGSNGGDPTPPSLPPNTFVVKVYHAPGFPPASGINVNLGYPSSPGSGIYVYIGQTTDSEGTCTWSNIPYGVVKIRVYYNNIAYWYEYNFTESMIQTYYLNQLT